MAAESGGVAYNRGRDETQFKLEQEIRPMLRVGKMQPDTEGAFEGVEFYFAIPMPSSSHLVTSSPHLLTLHNTSKHELRRPLRFSACPRRLSLSPSSRSTQLLQLSP
eukprot:5058995-Pleurochrysis_carterae.AAC.1